MAETDRALQELKKASPDDAIYKNAGSVPDQGQEGRCPQGAGGKERTVKYAYYGSWQAGGKSERKSKGS